MAADFTFVLAGKFGVGKTALFKRIQTGEFLDLSLATPNGGSSNGSDGELEHLIYRVKLNNVDYKVSIWDTGGLEKFRSMTSSYYRYSIAVILVYDSTPDQVGTIFNLEEWIREAKERSILKDRVVLSLWANKCDKSPPNADTPPEVTAFKQEHSIPDCLHFRVSAKTGENVISSLDSLIKFVHQNSSSINNVVNSGSGSVTTPVQSPRSTSPSFFDKCFKC